MLKRGEGEEGEEQEADRKAGQGGGLHFPVLGRTQAGCGRPIDARVRPGGTSATWAPCLAGGGVRRLLWKAS